MASFSTWRPLENRVLKTRFISPYITKQQPQQKKKSEPQGKKKKDEDEEMNWEKIRPPRPCEPGGLDCASPRSTTQAVRALGRASLSLFLLLHFFFPFWLWFLFLLVLFCYIWAWNRVFKTRFSSGQHVKNDATSDVIRPWK